MLYNTTLVPKDKFIRLKSNNLVYLCILTAVRAFILGPELLELGIVASLLELYPEWRLYLDYVIGLADPR